MNNQTQDQDPYNSKGTCVVKNLPFVQRYQKDTLVTNLEKTYLKEEDAINVCQEWQKQMTDSKYSSETGAYEHFKDLKYE